MLASDCDYQVNKSIFESLFLRRESFLSRLCVKAELWTTFELSLSRLLENRNTNKLFHFGFDRVGFGIFLGDMGDSGMVPQHKAISV